MAEEEDKTLPDAEVARSITAERFQEVWDKFSSDILDNGRSAVVKYAMLEGAEFRLPKTPRGYEEIAEKRQERLIEQLEEKGYNVSTNDHYNGKHLSIDWEPKPEPRRWNWDCIWIVVMICAFVMFMRYLGQRFVLIDRNEL